MKKFWKENYPCFIGFGAGVAVMLAAALLLFHGFGGLHAGLKLASLLRVFDTQFVTDYDIDAVTENVMAGAVEALDDRWSYYMTAEEYDDYKDTAANRYQGIGVTISKDEETGGFLVVGVNKNGPAQQAGIVAGDIILAVDGVDVTEGQTEDLRALIQADFGREALVTIRHEDGSQEEIAVSCVEVYTSPVEWQMLDGGVGYVRILNFREGAAADAIEAVDQLIADGAEGLVFDVRNDPGGQLTELIALLDHLLPEGEIFYRTDKRGRESVETSDAACVELPMAVIVNGDSYSAAEFFAAALREYDWAAVVGEPTTGKARSQVTVELVDGSAVHLSKYAYLTPDGVDLYEAGGIVPDVEVALSEEDRQTFDTGWLEPADDPQIQAAIDALLS